MSGEPTSKERAVADEVVEKSQLSCLILPINTGSELFSRVGCWDAGTRRFAVSGEPMCELFSRVCCKPSLSMGETERWRDVADNCARKS